MIEAVPVSEGFLAFYADRDGRMRTARNALGQYIVCETEALALSVARYRRRRLKIWR